MIHPFRRPADLAAVVSLLAVAGILGIALAQPPAAAPDTAAWRHSKLHGSYAEARLKLAEAKLEKARQLNARFPGLVSATDLRGLTTRINVLREEVADTQGHEHGYGFVVQRRSAEAAVKLAEGELEELRAISARKAEAVTPMDIKIHEIALEVARLRAQIWQDKSFLSSPVDVLQMQLDQIGDQLQDVIHETNNAPAMERR
jgi:hypothetical protein